jgi:hypothetical protein
MRFHARCGDGCDVRGISIVLALLQLHAPDGHPLWLNPRGILEFHDARVTHKKHFAPGTKCMISMKDGRTVATGDSCEDVIRKARENRS